MHEWALAEAVIAAVSQIAEKEVLKEVTEVKIKVGELQQIELDILEFALSQLKPPKFKHTKFSIELAKAELKCRVCSYKWFFKRKKWMKTLRKPYTLYQKLLTHILNVQNAEAQTLK